LLRDSIAGRGRPMANGAVDVEALFSPLHQIVIYLQRKTVTPIGAHFAGVEIIVAAAETEMRLHVYLGRNRRRARRSFAVRLRHLITDRHCARDGRARAAS